MKAKEVVRLLDCYSKAWKNKGKNTVKILIKNVYKEYNSVTDEVTVDQPYLTFGITIYDERDRRLLYVLDYLHIDEIIKRYD